MERLFLCRRARVEAKFRIRLGDQCLFGFTDDRKAPGDIVHIAIEVGQL